MSLLNKKLTSYTSIVVVSMFWGALFKIAFRAILDLIKCLKL